MEIYLKLDDKKPQIGILIKGVKDNLLVSDNFLTNIILPYDKILYFTIGIIIGPAGIPFYIYSDSLD